MKDDFLKIIKEYKEMKNSDIPEIDAKKVFEKIERRIKKTPQSYISFKRKLALGGFMAILIGAIFLFLSLFVFKTEKKEELTLSELKTEIVIPDKNIKIMWVQKRGFKLKNYKTRGGKNE